MTIHLTGGGGADPHTPTGSDEDDYWEAQAELYRWCQVDVDNVQGTVTLRARKNWAKGELIEDPYQL